LPNFLSEPQQQEEKTNQPLLSEVDLNQPEKSDTPPEQVFNRLIQSHWQKAQQKESKSQSIASTDDKDYREFNHAI
jgi:hypothetical protein